MYTSKFEKKERKLEKQLIFADAENYVIPAKEGWNEGYSSSNKFLYFNDVSAHNSKANKILS